MKNGPADQIRGALRALPQAPYIRPEDAQRWLNYAAANDPSRIPWLIGRLGSGFGGSEIGTLVLDVLGKTPLFQSWAELSNSKLMRTLPTPTTYPMRKGILLEQAVQQATLRIYGGNVDNEVLQAFDQPNNRLPAYLAGNPDFPWIRESHGNRVRTLVDIKVPGSGVDSLDSETKALHYNCQLNQYNHLNDLLGLPKFDQLMNINLELPPAVTDAMLHRLETQGDSALPAIVDEMVMLLKYDRPGMRLNMIEQDINPTLSVAGRQVHMIDLIHELAEPGWHGIINGVVPELHKRADTTLTDTQKTSLQTLESELVFRRGLAETNETRIEQITQAIRTECSQITKIGALSQTPHLNVKQVSKLNEPLAAQLIERYGIDANELRAERKNMKISDYDTMGLAQAYEALHHAVSTTLDSGELDQLEQLKDQAPLTAFVKPAPLSPEKVVDALHKVGENPERVINFHTQISASRKKITSELMISMRETFTPELKSIIEPHLQHDTSEKQDKTPESHTESPEPTLSL